MPHYLSQVSYTPEAWARLVAHPQDRIEAVRGPIEKLGGRIHNAFFAFGEYDVVAIAELPGNDAAVAMGLGSVSAGALSKYNTTVLLSPEEAVSAMKTPGGTFVS